MERIDIADASADLPALIDRASHGETIEIVANGAVAARLTAPPRRLIPPARPQAFDWDALNRFTRTLPPEPESTGAFVRRMRSEDL